MKRRMRPQPSPRRAEVAAGRPAPKPAPEAVQPPVGADRASLIAREVFAIQATHGNDFVQKTLTSGPAVAPQVPRHPKASHFAIAGSQAPMIARFTLLPVLGTARLLQLVPEQLEEETEETVRYAEAKLLSEEEATKERQRALDQARFTEAEQKEIDEVGLKKLLSELSAKNKDLKSSHKDMKAAQKALKKFKTDVTRATKQLGKKGLDEAKKDEINEKLAGLAKKIEETNEKLTTLETQRGEIEARIEVLKEIQRKNRYAAAMAKMEEALGDAGTDLAKWFDDFDPNATFLGLKVQASDQSRVAGVHSLMSAALAKAEATLLARPEFTGMSALDVAKELGVRRVSGLRQPKLATGKSESISPHCYGLAVDINATANPYVGLHGQTKVNKRVVSTTTQIIVKRATLLVLGAEKDIITLPSRKAGEMWEFLESASSALRKYFALRSDREALKKAVEKHLGREVDEATVDSWMEQINKDYDALKDKGDFKASTKEGRKTRDPARGFMDLQKVLVEALVAAGLSWGGMFQTAKDIQHFHVSDGKPKGKVAEAKAEGK